MVRSTVVVQSHKSWESHPSQVSDPQMVNTQDPWPWRECGVSYACTPPLASSFCF